MKQTTLRRLISLGLLLALGVLFTALSGSRFLNANNFIDIVRDASVTAIIGVGVTMAIITAGIDLSTGSIMAVNDYGEYLRLHALADSVYDSVRNRRGAGVRPD